jgi:hypothetical protein
MSPEARLFDSLARAIQELREDLVSWIDTELARLQGLDQEEDPAVGVISGESRSLPSGQRGGRYTIPLTDGQGTRPGTRDGVSGMETGTARTPERFADRHSDTDITESPTSVIGSKADPESQDAPLNPRQRLDALARLLDHRLKQVGGTTGEDRKTTNGRGEGMRDEPRDHPGRPGVGRASEMG